jgi:hypothetical protein
MLANHSIKIFFSLKEMNAAIKVAEQIDQYVPSHVVSPKADTILFHYNVGRIYIHFHRFAEADEILSLAFKQCLKSHRENLQKILVYLIVARFIRGKLPSDKLLEQYQLTTRFSGLVRHYKAGNFASYLAELERQKDWLLHHGFYLIMLHRANILLFRNLFSKM